MAEPRDELLGALALQRGWITPAQLHAAFEAQERAPEKDLAAILSASRLLSEERVRELEEEIDGSDVRTQVDARKEFYVCPSCGAKFTITNPRPGQVHRCRKCSGVLQRRVLAPAGGPREGQRFGKYVIQGELGKGGMGVVYRAWDPDTSRSVALKCMQRADDPTEVARFEREARTSLSLDHPNVVRVYEVGVHEGLPYLVMELVSGKALSDLLSPHRKKEERPPLEKVLEWIRDAALALGHAHGKEIVHRDVKPQNVMVDDEGRVRVMDFGLARELRRGLTVTTTGNVIGTPQYMAPEQASGDRGALSPRTDVWALGVMLYEAAARAAPFDGETAAEILHRITHEDAVPVRKRNPRVAAELETVIMKCREPDPLDRYSTGTKLAEDLSRHLDGIPVTARPPSLLRKLRRKMARRKGTWIAAAAGLAATLGVAAILVPSLGSARREAAEATAGRAAAEHSMQLWARISNFITEAEVNARAGEVALARAKLEEGIRACRSFLATRELAHARYFLGRLLRAQGKRAEARAELEAAIRLDPKLGEARHERGLLLVEEYRSRLSIAFQTAVALRGSSAKPPAIVDLEREDPELAALRQKARQDLSVEVGQSSYFRPADGLFGKAQLAETEGAKRAAAELYRKVFAADPSYVRALSALAYLEIEAGALDEAVAHAGEAIRKHQGLGPAYLARCDARLIKARALPLDPDAAAWRKAARDDAEKAIAMGEETDLAYYTRANSRWMDGDPEGAIRDFGEALRLNPRASGVYANRGAIRAMSGDHDGAVRDFDEALRVNPLNAPAHTNRGISLMKKGDLPGARAAHDQALKLDPDLAVAWINRADVRSKQGDLEGSEADSLKAAELDPENAIVHHNRGVNHLRKGDLRAAIQDFDRAIRLDPRYVDAWGNRGYARQQLKDHDGAIEDLTAALKLDPGHVLSWVNRGNARRSKGDAAGALADYDAALKIGPDLLAHYNRGILREARGDLDGAIADHTEALKINPAFTQALRNRASAREAKGDAKGAFEDYDAALKLEPGHSGTWTNRAHVRTQLGDDAAAIQDLDEAIRLDPGNHIAWSNRGNAKARRREFASAIADFGEALRLSPAYPTAWFGRGVARGQSGDVKGAVEDLRKALEVAPPNWPYRTHAEGLLRGAGEKP